jgi:TolB-like protein/Flp pilus assembly protein TadD
MAATRECAIRDELDRVLASAAFARADRLRRFLRFVVEETLAGRQDDIKESVIALHVCGRDGSFDAKTDPIVRVDATRLRARLGEYYDTQGRDASLRIDLPKGSYVPRFVAGPAAACLRGSARPLTIAVLPFVNIGAGADDGFSDGLTEELIHQLSRIPTLRVIARTSAFQYRARSVDVRKIAADLNVSHVVEGSVRAAGEQIRVTAQLTAVDDRTIRWSAKYERQLTDVLKVQDDICANVTRALQLELLDGTVPARASSASARAHVAYLKGRHFWNRRTAASLMQSLEQYAAAVALDEHYARAYCGMADTLFVQALNDQLSAADAMPRAIEQATRALDVDPDLPEALVSLASIASIYEWDWLKGDALFRHATSLNPRAPLAPYLHAVLNLAPRARWEEALVAMDTAMELDPVSPVLHRDLGMIHYLRGDYREAEAVLRAAHALDPSFHGVYFWLARTLIEAGRLDDALGALQSRLAAPAPNARVVATMIEVLTKTGRATEAEDHWDALQRRAGEQTVPPLSVALAYLARGDRPGALACLEQAARDRAPALYQLAVDPVFRPLRDEPALAAILRTMGLGRVRR